jgi:hypothetical protein
MKGLWGTRPSLGTLDWIDARNGELHGGDYPLLFATTCVAVGNELYEQLRGSIAWARPPQASYAVKNLAIPPTPAAVEAKKVCAQLVPVPLRNHSFRTFAWATIIAENERIEHDCEVLFVASMLHDVGLSDRHSSGVNPGCFTVIGKNLTLQIRDRVGWSETSCRAAAESITLHVNPRVPLDDGPEAHLLARATRFDVIGNNYRGIDQVTRADVVRLWPREPGIKHCFVELFSKNKHHARSRANFYRLLGFRLLLRATRFWHDQ